MTRTSTRQRSAQHLRPLLTAGKQGEARKLLERLSHRELVNLAKVVHGLLYTALLNDMKDNQELVL